MSFLDDLFGGKPKADPNFYPSLYGYQRIAGVPSSRSPEAQRVYGNYAGRGLVPTDEEIAAAGGSYRDQGLSAISRYGTESNRLIDAYGSNGGTTPAMLRALAADITGRGQRAGSTILGDFDTGTGRLSADVAALIARAQQYGTGRADQINRDFDVAGQRGAGSVIGKYYGRGLGASTIASGAASQFGGEIERARAAALQNASEDAIGQELGARQFGIGTIGQRLGQRPGVQQYATELGYRGDPYTAQAIGSQDDMIRRMLGLRLGIQDQTLGLLANPSILYPQINPQIPGTPMVQGGSPGLGGIGQLGLGALSFLGGNALGGNLGFGGLGGGGGGGYGLNSFQNGLGGYGSYGLGAQPFSLGFG